MKRLNVGMLGTGFMGRTHSNAFNQVKRFFDLPYDIVLKSCYSRDAEKLARFQKTWGYEKCETDWRKIVDDDEIDLIDVVTPNFLHKDMVVAAAKAGKMIICEKPLAMNYEEALEMEEAVKAAGVPSVVSFCYRRNPSVALFKQLIDENRIGRPFHYRATYNQDYTISKKVPVGGASLWRLDANVAGSGVTGDLLAHSIDCAEWLNGPIARVCAHTEIFIKERQNAVTGEATPITIDDACMFMAIFANGSLGLFESSRYARGRKNFNTMEMNGENGACYFNLEEPEYLQFFRYSDPDTGKKIEDHLTGWQRILVTNSEHPYMNHYWVPGTVIGYEHYFINQLADFLLETSGGAPVYPVPTISDAVRVQKVCDAVLRSAREKTWVEL
ncbi:MAG: Gfo/Idh/MocA family oxidoreductase [Thermoguttaceae bacterium]|nr:Gfo/Idh/MocA family oxidoreductase [Thermoguttaceae bacterium]